MYLGGIAMVQAVTDANFETETKDGLTITDFLVV